MTVVGRRALRLLLPLVAAGCGPAPVGGRDWQAHPAVFERTGVSTIDVLGDVHGDPDVTVRVLTAAGLIAADAPHGWTGGETVLIVTGDVIDKGASAIPIIDLFMALEPEARAAGGDLVVTLGNHEAEFVADPTADKAQEFVSELVSLGLDPAAVAGGQTKYGAWLATRPVAALVDGWFFAHGGNSQGLGLPAIAESYQALFSPAGVPQFDAPFLVGPQSLLEADAWWQSGASATAVIDRDLAALPADHIVFGHDPSEIDFPDDPAGKRGQGKMVARYEGRIFLIDVGMSYAVGDSNGSLLQIARGTSDQATQILAGGGVNAIWP